MAKPKRFNKNQFESKLQQLMDNHHCENITVNDMAGYFEVNVATLRRWCNEHLETSPKKYIAQYRLLKAKALLSLEVSTSAVSKQLGFSEIKVFCTIFKRYEKMTPLEYSTYSKIQRTEVISSAQTNNDINGLNGE
ncbi:MAG: helix-turn-helix domain-containing protein [Colwellia sp.]